jgi:hypothetical protein
VELEVEEKPKPKIFDMTGPTIEEERKAQEEEESVDDSQGSASDQEDYEVEDENFSWYNDKTLKDSTYFVLVYLPLSDYL